MSGLHGHPQGKKARGQDSGKHAIEGQHHEASHKFRSYAARRWSLATTLTMSVYVESIRQYMRLCSSANHIFNLLHRVFEIFTLPYSR